MDISERPATDAFLLITRPCCLHTTFTTSSLYLDILPTPAPVLPRSPPTLRIDPSSLPLTPPTVSFFLSRHSYLHYLLHDTNLPIIPLFSKLYPHHRHPILPSTSSSVEYSTYPSGLDDEPQTPKSTGDDAASHTCRRLPHMPPSLSWPSRPTTLVVCLARRAEHPDACREAYYPAASRLGCGADVVDTQTSCAIHEPLPAHALPHPTIPTLRCGSSQPFRGRVVLSASATPRRPPVPVSTCWLFGLLSMTTSRRFAGAIRAAVCVRPRADACARRVDLQPQRWKRNTESGLLDGDAIPIATGAAVSGSPNTVPSLVRRPMLGHGRFCPRVFGWAGTCGEHRRRVWVAKRELSFGREWRD
ncbi:hypothetical protein HMN09_01369000 [Mycena chlorophos]|uniref:Uncharacterized protein n=1 Tax=Mycena chlorophos TaxID=658473 RepID=A0A8H6S071_MYCCL|nr:hypothetical protein HMN09_01369000 [Mycena chlorophos]